MGLTKPDAPSDATYLVTEEHALLTAEELIEGDYSTYTKKWSEETNDRGDAPGDYFWILNSGIAYWYDRSEDELLKIDVDGTRTSVDSDVLLERHYTDDVLTTYQHSLLSKYIPFLDKTTDTEIVVFKDGVEIFRRDVETDVSVTLYEVLHVRISPNGKYVLVFAQASEGGWDTIVVCYEGS